MYNTDVLDDLLQLLENQNDFDREHLNNVLREFSDEQKLKYKYFMKSMRSILSGLSVSSKMNNIFVSMVSYYQTQSHLGRTRRCRNDGDSRKTKYTTTHP